MFPNLAQKINDRETRFGIVPYPGARGRRVARGHRAHPRRFPGGDRGTGLVGRKQEKLDDRGIRQNRNESKLGLASPIFSLANLGFVLCNRTSSDREIFVNIEG